VSAFSVGQRVRVREHNPPTHIRTPLYIQGRVGTIERLHGAFRNPEDLAYGREGLPKRDLYLVGFEYQTVIEGAPATDRVLVDIYEHWLEPEETA
jgi:nitrile hydratase